VKWVQWIGLRGAWQVARMMGLFGYGGPIWRCIPNVLNSQRNGNGIGVGQGDIITKDKIYVQYTWQIDIRNIPLQPCLRSKRDSYESTISEMTACSVHHTCNGKRGCRNNLGGNYNRTNILYSMLTVLLLYHNTLQVIPRHNGFIYVASQEYDSVGAQLLDHVPVVYQKQDMCCYGIQDMRGVMKRYKMRCEESFLLYRIY
jgi:hypothetical protein